MEDFILKSGYGAVCMNLLENSASLLLAELLKETCPSLEVTGFLPSLPGIPEETRERVEAFAGTAGIGVRTVSFPAKAGGLDEKAAIAWLMRQWAEEEGALLISSLTGTDIMTAPRFLPAALAADFMPLGIYTKRNWQTCSPVLFLPLRRPPGATGFSSARTGNMNPPRNW